MYWNSYTVFVYILTVLYAAISQRFGHIRYIIARYGQQSLITTFHNFFIQKTETSRAFGFSGLPEMCAVVFHLENILIQKQTDTRTASKQNGLHDKSDVDTVSVLTQITGKLFFTTVTCISGIMAYLALYRVFNF